MKFRLMSHRNKLAIGVVLVACVSACVSLGPSLEEQVEAMSSAQFSPDSRYAVVARNTNGHQAPPPISVPMADTAAEQVAKVVSDSLVKVLI